MEIKKQNKFHGFFKDWDFTQQYVIQHPDGRSIWIETFSDYRGCTLAGIGFWNRRELRREFAAELERRAKNAAQANLTLGEVIGHLTANGDKTVIITGVPFNGIKYDVGVALLVSAKDN
jgi:hypothetical protein